MVQLWLNGSPASERPTWLRVVDDFGPINKGVSEARYVLAENGSEYIIKGPSLAPDHPHIAANEVIVATLAKALGLPVLDFGVVEMGGRLFFASAWMQKGSFYPAIDEGIFNRCENRDRVYDLIVFDAWLCNQDRHAENLIARARDKARGSLSPTLLLLNDHGHCLVQPHGSASDLAPILDTPPGRYVMLDFVRNAITEDGRLASAVDAVEDLDDNAIRTNVRSLPDEFLPVTERPLVEDFLIERRARLRNLFRDQAHAFPGLQGGRV